MILFDITNLQICVIIGNLSGGGFGKLLPKLDVPGLSQRPDFCKSFFEFRFFERCDGGKAWNHIIVLCESGKNLFEFGVIGEPVFDERIGHLPEDGNDLWRDIFEKRIDDEAEIFDLHIDGGDAAYHGNDGDAEGVDIAFGHRITRDLFWRHISVGAGDGGAAALDLRVCDGAEVDEGDFISVLRISYIA